MSQLIQSIKTNGRDLIILLIIFLFTFQRFEPDFGIGLDTSYVWGLNHLFVHDYDTLIQLIYPIGPLGFLRLPTTEGHNLIYALVFYTALKALLISLLLKLDTQINQKRTTAAILFIFIAALFANIDLLIIANTFVLQLLNLGKKNLIPFIASLFIALTGLFIKTSIGIISLSIVGIAPILLLINNKNFTYFLKQLIIGLLILLTYGLVLFKGNMTLFLTNLLGVIKLSGGYSGTLSLHPENDWRLLGAFLLLILSLPIFIKENYFRQIFILLLFPLFATWKHAMVRQDIYHYFILIVFLFVFGSILSIFLQKKKNYLLGVFAISILLLYANMQNLHQYRPNKKEIIGINNFTEIIDFHNFKSRFADFSAQAIHPNILPDDIRKLIGNETIDIYPWEHSYAAANQLHWQPRKTLEIGASTSQWASAKAAENFSFRESAPEFVLFHLQNDGMNGRFGSIDGRYILNDEPLLIANIFNHYNLIEQKETYLLFRKNKRNNFAEINLEKTLFPKFGQWMDIPQYDDGITRVKLYSPNNTMGALKKFFYKEAKYLVDYQLEDGTILTYRYVSSTAIDGLWCNPFLQHPSSNTIEQKTIKIRVRNPDTKYHPSNVEMQFEHIKTTQPVNSLFQKSKVSQDSIFLSQKMDFEDSNLDGDQLSQKTIFGTSAQKISPNRMSNVFEYQLDTLWQHTHKQALKIAANIRYLNPNSSAKIVMSIADANENNKHWSGKKIAKTFDTITWGFTQEEQIFSFKKQPTGILKIYVWNTGHTDILLDEFRVTLSTPKQQQ